MIQIDKSNLSKEIADKYSIANNAFRLDKIKNAELDIYTNEPKDELNVIVGDDKQPDTFYPQVKLCRWTNEVNFSVRLKHDEKGNEKIETIGDKIKWSKGNIEVEFYDFVEGEGGYKMVWYLKKKPATNKVEFTLQTKGLDFFYQPELTPKEIAEGATRPPEVVGSYAVYHQTKGGMVDKFGKDYKTGKAFHIYRPHLFDTSGKEAWGNLNIDVALGTYTVEIPQAFLDKAVYPIRSNDTFGYTTLGVSGGTGIGEALSDLSRLAGGAYNLSSSGTLDSIHAGLDITTAETVDIFLALYREDSGGVGIHARVASVESLNLSISTTAAFYQINAASESLSADDYILAALGNGEDLSTGNVLQLQYDILSNKNVYAESSTGAGSYAARKAENPWTEVLFSSAANYSIYATYTPSGGTPAVIPASNLSLMGCG